MISSGFNTTEKRLVLSVGALQGLQQRDRKAMSRFSQKCLGQHKALQPQRTPSEKRDTRGNSQVKFGWIESIKKIMRYCAMVKISILISAFFPVALDWLLTDSVIKLLVFLISQQKMQSCFSASHFPPLSLHTFTGLGLFCILPFFIIPFSINNILHTAVLCPADVQSAIIYN